jgi:hypothetical protein
VTLRFTWSGWRGLLPQKSIRPRRHGSRPGVDFCAAPRQTHSPPSPCVKPWRIPEEAGDGCGPTSPPGYANLPLHSLRLTTKPCDTRSQRHASSFPRYGRIVGFYRKSRVSRIASRQPAAPGKGERPPKVRVGGHTTITMQRRQEPGSNQVQPPGCLQPASLNRSVPASAKRISSPFCCSKLGDHRTATW